MEGLTTLVKQTWKNFEELPGWGLLYFIVYLVLGKWPLQNLIKDLGFELTLPEVSIEIWATMFTLILYLFGDALDKVTFLTNQDDQLSPFGINKLRPKWHVRGFYLKEIEDARKELKVVRGIYGVSMKVLEGAEQASGVHLWNELAKTFRSLVLPVFVVLGVLAWKLPYPRSPIFLVLAGLFAFVLGWIVYPLLKNCHRRMLYTKIVKLHKGEKGREEYAKREASTVEEQKAEVKRWSERKKLIQMPNGKVLMFFWDGTLVATGIKTPDVVVVPPPPPAAGSAGGVAP